jgi:hypothetical protein
MTAALFAFEGEAMNKFVQQPVCPKCLEPDPVVTYEGEQ